MAELPDSLSSSGFGRGGDLGSAGVYGEGPVPWVGGVWQLVTLGGGGRSAWGHLARPRAGPALLCPHTAEGRAEGSLRGRERVASGRPHPEALWEFVALPKRPIRPRGDGSAGEKVIPAEPRYVRGTVEYKLKV